MRLLLVLISLSFSTGLFALDCGADNQRPCNVWEHIPSCQDNLVERHGRCMANTTNNMAHQRPNWCGKDGQPACKINEFIAACVTGLTEREGVCQAPQTRPAGCGHSDQRPCNLDEFFPGCEKSMIIRNGKCVDANTPCGWRNQPPCDAVTKGGKYCNGGYALALDSKTNTCQTRDSVCGTLGKRPCTLGNKDNYTQPEYYYQTEGPCVEDLVIENGVCSKQSSAISCGSHDKPPCFNDSGTTRQYYCSRGWSISNGKCVRISQPANQTCGALNHRPCRIGERNGNSCDPGLREDFIKNICIQ